MADSVRRGPWGTLFIVGGVMILLAAGAAWYLVPVQYEAFALLKVSIKRPTVLAKGRLDEENFAVFKRTQAELLTSLGVLNGTLRDPSIHQLSIAKEHDDDQVAWLKGQLDISFPNDAEIMRVAMKGTNREDLLKIVDKVVEVYLQEVVYNEKRLLLENEEKLRAAYEKQKADYETQLGALAKLQQYYHTSGSETAQLRKTLARDTLSGLLAQRVQIADEIRQTSVEIALAEGRKETIQDVRTADSVVATGVVAVEPLSLALLLRKKAILEEQLAQTEKEIEAQTRVVEGLETYSEKVAAKQEEIEAVRSIKDQLGAKVRLADVERLAPDRIRRVDAANLVDGHGDVVRRDASLAALAALGLGLVVLGVALLRPRRPDR